MNEMYNKKQSNRIHINTHTELAIQISISRATVTITLALCGLCRHWARGTREAVAVNRGDC